MTQHPTDHAGLEILLHQECLRLLASVPVGRVGFAADGEIVILPVNYLLDGQTVVFRTTHGSKLGVAAGGEKVAFEADAYDEQARSGWSVVVSGNAEVVYDEAEAERLSARGLRPWPTAADRPFWVRVKALSITGRRIPLPPS